MDTVPCTPIHTTLLADSQAKQIETEPNHPITHGGGLRTQTEAEFAVKVTDTKFNDRAVDKAAPVGIDVDLPLIKASKDNATVKAAADEEDVIRSRCDKAAQVGIDVPTQKARKLLCNLSISLEDAILRLSPELKVRELRSSS
jgi:hypothetical protein